MRVVMLRALFTAVLVMSGTVPETIAQLKAEANVPVEISFTSRSAHTDSFNALSVDVIFTDPKNAVLRVPAFWAGGSQWKARYSSPIVGNHKWRTECNITNDTGLHGVTGWIETSRYRGANPLY